MSTLVLAYTGPSTVGWRFCMSGSSQLTMGGLTIP
ncbi:unnamed protein product [Fusarium venenatum]|uniref:Uncharacterized protein n=1 Tax=Fusarium venenatum TaxID=56646 RepID=A0A2L2TS20_9HYPO|nr:uncharacterized protein FVRRES_09028 [Fusarium venenatum]CEI68951.1 unnamed protein product [Fusarium venenatum]